MTAHILIDGQGLLADFVYDQLSGNYLVKRQSILEEIPEETELALVLHDAWHPSVHQKAEERFRSHRYPVASRFCFVWGGNHWSISTSRYAGMFSLC